MSKVPIEFQDFNPLLQAMVPYGPFRAIVKEIVDGDTFYAYIDLAFNEYRFMSIRLKDVKAAELYRGTFENRELGRRAKLKLATLLPLGTQVVLVSYTDEQSFGRYIAETYISPTETINQIMRDYIEAGYPREPGPPNGADLHKGA